MVEAIVFLIFPLCLTLAAFTDFLEMTIPNRIPVVLLGAFAIAAPLAGLGVIDIGFHLLAGLAVFAVCFALFAFNVMGGGDAKLLTAAAVWFGFNLSLVSFLTHVAYIGGALTLLILLLRARSNTMMAIGLPLPGSILHAKKIPYGIAIGIAGLLTYPQSPLVVWAMQP